VPRYSGLIELKVRCYLATAEFSLGKEPQNLDPIRMAEGLAHLGDPLVNQAAPLIVIHLLMHPSRILHTIVSLSMEEYVMSRKNRHRSAKGEGRLEMMRAGRKGTSPTPKRAGEQDILAKLYVEPTSECNLHGKEGTGNFFVYLLWCKRENHLDLVLLKVDDAIT